MRAEFVAGFTVAEVSFTSSGDGRRFAFTIALGAVDGAMCDRLAAFFGVGRVYGYRRRHAHHDDVRIFTVQSKRDLVDVIVPFMDAHLPPSNRRRQFDAWRVRLIRPGGAYSLAAAGSSVTSVAQSTGEASDQRRSRS